MREKMEKNNGDVRRVYTRHSSSGPNNSNKRPFLLDSDYSRGEKVKRLSVLTEMGSNVEDDLQSSTLIPRKFKLPKKVFVGSNIPVDPASVPRKLRSAVKKRGCKSAPMPLVDSKRSKHLANGVEPLKEDCLNKAKLSMQNGCSVSMSKDEEEVAETLFALAGMIPLNIKCSKAKTSDLAKTKNDNPLPSSQDPVILKAEPETACYPSSNGVTNATVAAKASPTDHVQVKVKPMIEPGPFSWSKVSERRQLNLNSEVSAPLMHLQTIPPLLRACDQRQHADSTFFCSSPEPSNTSRLNGTKQENGLRPKSQSHISVGARDIVARQEMEHAAITKTSDNGLTSRHFHGFGVDGIPQQSSAVIFPSWLNNDGSTHTQWSCIDTVAADKVLSSGNGGRKSWKRCIAHVCISRLIQILQKSEGKDTRPSDACQLRQSQCSSVVPDNYEVNGTLTGSHMFSSAASKTICGTGVGVPVKVGHHQDQEDGSYSSGRCGSKQSFDFLSLSTGAVLEANDGLNGSSNSLEAKSHVFYLQSAAQLSAPIPCSMPQTYPYRDQVAVASMSSPQVHLQRPPYFGNPFGPAHLGITGSTQQQQPKQQQIWTAQLAGQSRAGLLLSSHIENWQNGRQDQRSSTAHMQSHLPPSQPSLEMIGAKYLHMSQQQVFELRPSLPPSNAKPQSSPLPLICEDKGSRFRPEGVLPLQLLCNDRL